MGLILLARQRSKQIRKQNAHQYLAMGLLTGQNAVFKRFPSFKCVAKA